MSDAELRIKLIQSLTDMPLAQLRQVFAAVQAIQKNDGTPLFAVNLWGDRKPGDTRSAVLFFHDEYKDYVDKGMNRVILRHLDKPLYTSVTKWMDRNPPAIHPEFLHCLYELKRPPVPRRKAPDP